MSCWHEVPNLKHRAYVGYAPHVWSNGAPHRNAVLFEVSLLDVHGDIGLYEWNRALPQRSPFGLTPQMSSVRIYKHSCAKVILVHAFSRHEFVSRAIARSRQGSICMYAEPKNVYVFLCVNEYRRFTDHVTHTMSFSTMATLLYATRAGSIKDRGSHSDNFTLSMFQ